MGSHSSPLGDATVVLMAKAPEPGRAKTRLTGDGTLMPETAAAIAAAMLRCTARRLASAVGPDASIVVGVSPDGGADALRPVVGDDVPCRFVDQGGGDLGVRLDRVWRHVDRQGRIAFFGADAPDVPASALVAIAESLGGHDAAIGPTEDGGYWTLAAAGYLPALLQDIDWGGDSVYDRTLLNARRAGLSVGSLPVWRDVDHPSDLDALRRRLAANDPRDDALDELAERLDALCGPLTLRRTTR